MKIGLIGEDPYDTDSLKNLLSRNYDKNIVFKKLLRNERGSNLLTDKASKKIYVEIKSEKIDICIFSIDIDDLETNTKKINEIKSKIDKNLKGINYILLLHIYELECLILSDINTFNKIFGVKIVFNSNPMFKEKPKEFLVEKTRKSNRIFNVSENPEIFKQLDIEEVKKNCKYFREFINLLDQKVKQK